MAIKEVDRVIIDEQKSSRKSSRRNSGAPIPPAPKRAINVVEENEDTKVRASLTPDGKMRVEVVDKNEGVISDHIASDSDTCRCFLYRHISLLILTHLPFAPIPIRSNTGITEKAFLLTNTRIEIKVIS